MSDPVTISGNHAYVALVAQFFQILSAVNNMEETFGCSPRYTYVFEIRGHVPIAKLLREEVLEAQRESAYPSLFTFYVARLTEQWAVSGLLIYLACWAHFTRLTPPRKWQPLIMRGRFFFQLADLQVMHQCRTYFAETIALHQITQRYSTADRRNRSHMRPCHE